MTKFLSPVWTSLLSSRPTYISQSDLKLNMSTTEAIVFTNLLSLHMFLSSTNGKVQKLVTSPVAQGRNLGFILDFFLPLILPANVNPLSCPHLCVCILVLLTLHLNDYENFLRCPLFPFHPLRFSLHLLKTHI